MTRIAIVGTRPPRNNTREDWDTYQRLLGDAREFVDTLPAGTVVITGGAIGVDNAVDEAATDRGLRVVIHRPKYKHEPRPVDMFDLRREPCGCAACKRAPLERNTLIVDDADEVYAFPSPWSRGTFDTIRKAEAAGKLRKVPAKEARTG